MKIVDWLNLAFSSHHRADLVEILSHLTCRVCFIYRTCFCKHEVMCDLYLKTSIFIEGGATEIKGFPVKHFCTSVVQSIMLEKAAEDSSRIRMSNMELIGVGAS